MIKVIHIFTALIKSNKKRILKFSYFFYCTMCITFVLSPQSLFAQNELDLAKEYYKKKEYDKVLTTLKKIAKKEDSNPELHDLYWASLLETKQYDDATKYIKSKIKTAKTFVIFQIQLAELLELNNKLDDSKLQYNTAITIASGTLAESDRACKYFYEKQEYELLEQQIVATRKAQNLETYNSLRMTEVYRFKNNKQAMVQEYLAYCSSANDLDQFKVFLQDNLKDPTDKLLVEKALYSKIQLFPENNFYAEALIGHLVNQKQFFKAFLQTKALDKRLGQDGQRMLELAHVSLENGDYANAIKMFQYLTTEYKTSSNYYYYRQNLLESQEKYIKNTYPVSKEAIENLIKDYDAFIDENGVNFQTAEAIKNKANLLAFHLDKKEEASQLLEQIIKIGARNTNFVSRCKLDLGDIQLLMGDFWEATLTYQQVSVAEKDSPLSYDAKLRNARLNFYKGDFEVAEDFLGILKKATSREIANDALWLNLLIRNNTGSDSTEAPMKSFAKASLFQFQNKYKESIAELSDLIEKYPNDNLLDEALFERSKAYVMETNYLAAEQDLKKILEKFPEDTFGDNAMYNLAGLYQTELKQPEKAKELYEKFLKQFSGSIYVPEVRLKYRLLRGDSIE
jgi:tetratricopeptide (TPR) repeat protein